MNHIKINNRLVQFRLIHRSNRPLRCEDVSTIPGNRQLDVTAEVSIYSCFMLPWQRSHNQHIRHKCYSYVTFSPQCHKKRQNVALKTMGALLARPGLISSMQHLHRWVSGQARRYDPVLMLAFAIFCLLHFTAFYKTRVGMGFVTAADGNPEVQCPFHRALL